MYIEFLTNLQNVTKNSCGSQLLKKELPEMYSGMMQFLQIVEKTFPLNSVKCL